VSLPPEWEEILRRDVPFYASLSADDRERFEAKLVRFVDGKNFLPAAEFEIELRMKVVIGGVASRLSMNLPLEEYRRLESVSVYQRAIETDDGHAIGVAFLANSVSLSWPDVLAGLADPSDARNVGYHEFAHVLDASDGISDGRPPLVLTPELHRLWKQVMIEEWAKLAGDLRGNRASVMDPYGATSVVELFAVATEAFFERPRDLKERHPDLFMLLATYYQQDPSV
jgi:hypothetical protein